MSSAHFWFLSARLAWWSARKGPRLLITLRGEKTGNTRGKGQNISFSIEDIQYYVLFNIIAGPEAVLRQPLEDTKA